MKKKAVALLLAIVMVVSLLPTAVFAGEADEFTVVVSMEGLTLGQGMYVEPTAYTLDKINALIAEEGYGPYTEDDLPASMATLAMMLDKGLEYENTGSWDSGFYLSAVKGIDKGTDVAETHLRFHGGGLHGHCEHRQGRRFGGAGVGTVLQRTDALPGR